MKILSIVFLLFAFFSAFASDVSPRIAFERENKIWIADLDGKSAKKISDGSLPEISADGTRVAFNTDEPGAKIPIRHIAVADIATGKVTVLKDMPSNNCFGPVWSPDGKSLLFSIYMDEDWQLGLINADGTGFRIVKKTETKDHSYYSPCWAADGKSYFCHDLDAIYRFDMEGALLKKWDIHTIVENGDMNSNSRMSASPDGKSLIMDIDMDEDHNRDNWDGPPPAIWLLNLSADKAERLTRKDYFAWDPFWINSDEFIFLSQGPKENEPSLYRGSARSGNYTLVIKNGRTPSASR